MMSSDAQSTTCPRCGKAFHCGVNSPRPCPCSALPLSPAQLAAIAERWQGCLCLECLRQISKEESLGSSSA